MGEIKHAYWVLASKPEGKRTRRKYGRILLNRISKKQVGRAWTRFIYLAQLRDNCKFLKKDSAVGSKLVKCKVSWWRVFRLHYCRM
jgi:hypothetical protein